MGVTAGDTIHEKRTFVAETAIWAKKKLAENLA